MARGWESKSVEDQIEIARADRALPAEPILTAGELEVRTRRQSLELARTQILSRIESTRDERYLAQLRLALAHLDGQLASLESDPRHPR